MTKYIPIWQYAKNNDTSAQNIYRWMREGKIPKDKFVEVEKVVKRKMIAEDFVRP